MAGTKTDNHIGEMLRLHREKTGISVRTLATRAGFSPSFISQVENGVASPSIGSLEKIAACLDVSLAELFVRHDGPASNIVRAKERPRLESGWSQAGIENLRSERSSRLEPLLITLQPGGASGKRGHAISREQFVFVVAGQVTLSLDGVDQTLAKGDAVTIRAESPALWINGSEKPVQLLFVSHSIS
jgi:XRE family transcriptional regulator, regulator of sulfur utilization